MNDLQTATELICDLKGSLMAHEALLTAMLDGLTLAEREALGRRFRHNAEVARTVMLNSPTSEHTMAAFERDVLSAAALLRG